jgi:stage II sporulation protein D
VVRHALVAVVLVALVVAGVASAGLLAATPTTTSVANAVCAPTPASALPTTTATTTVYTSVPACTTTTDEPSSTATTAAVTTARVTTTTQTVTSSSAATTLVITGHGWGHGMGMSQWGAYGYAEHGWNATQILLHYYSGTTVSHDPSPTVRVLLFARRHHVALNSTAPWQVADARGTKVALPAGKLIVTASLEVGGQQLVSPLTFTAGTTPLSVGKRPYRGSIDIVSNGKTFQVVNAVGMEQYLDGVVGAEMPQSWPQAALQAQAIAARTYALAELQTVVTASAFDLYDDTRSQVYGGIDAESAPVTEAVSATDGQVVLYDGKVATTYFSASSGGRTVSAAEALGTPIPYLVSVDDPYDTMSPYHDWGPVLLDAKSAGAALGVGGPLLDLQTVAGASDHVATATAFGPTRQVTLSGAELRDDLGLRSSWFQVGWLTLTPPAAPITFGTTLSLAGAARGLSAVSLEERTSATDWRTVGAVDPDGSGAFAVKLSPTATTRYRLSTGAVRGALIEVRVMPQVSTTESATGVEGTIRPDIVGSPLALQRQDGSRWATVATDVTGAGGTFAISATLSPGTYRVRCAPGHGLSPGDSTPFAAPS